MAEMFYDDDADLGLLSGKTVAIIGYGSQGHAHALSLRDSGVDVRVGLKEGSRSRAKAEAEGLRVLNVADAVAEADLIMILAPDQHQRAAFGVRGRGQPGAEPGHALDVGRPELDQHDAIEQEGLDTLDDHLPAARHQVGELPVLGAHDLIQRQLDLSLHLARDRQRDVVVQLLGWRQFLHFVAHSPPL